MTVALLKLYYRSVLLVLHPSLLCSAAWAQAKAPEIPFTELARIANSFDIEIVTADLSFPVKTTHGMIAGTNAVSKELKDYISLFVQEFGLYPPDLVRRSQLKRVVLCSELSFGGQRRNAIPDFEHDTLYFDVSRGAHNQSYLRKVIHHEYFHLIDYRYDGNVYKDDCWESLNPDNFAYGGGGAAVQDMSRTSILTDQIPGFLNHYSTTGVEEDKAEFFANMIVDHKYVESRARKDRVINAKLERMKELLVEFCPEMNEMFWEKVRTVKSPDNRG